MSRLIAPAFAALLASAGAPADAGVHVTADPECRVIRYLPNGRRLERPPTKGATLRPGAGISAHAATTGGGSAAGVSVSSSSGGSGYASASASSSGRRGRTVTTTHDHNGCTIVIDDRVARGARR